MTRHRVRRPIAYIGTGRATLPVAVLLWVAVTCLAAPVWVDAQLASSQPAIPATQPDVQVRLNFKDTPLDAVLEHLSQVAGLAVVKETPVEGKVTVISMQPVTAAQAVTLLDAVLKSNGYTAIVSGRTLRIVARDKAKKGNIPVQFGDDPNTIAPTDELITQVIPVKNVDAVHLLNDLKPLIPAEADVAANAGANAIIITDASSDILRIVRIISIMDRREDTASGLKIIRLKNASAPAAVRLILAIFHVEEPPANPNQPRPPKPENTGRIGTGVERALEGGKLTAAADERTNTIVIAGPNETLKVIENILRELDESPASTMTVKMFHLKVADASAVARLIASLFREEGVAPQARGGGDQALHARVTAAPEEHTNTLVVTAPTTVMAIIEQVINDLEKQPQTDANLRSYHLKYADATSAARELTSVFNEGQSQVVAGAHERMNATADARTNTVIVTGSPDVLHTVDRLVEELDANPTAGSDVRFFHLKQADAVTAAKLIAAFFKPPEEPSQQRRRREPTEFVSVNAQADDRSNTVVVNAPPDAMKVVEQIVREIETEPASNLEIRSYALKYADADDTAKLISGMFQPDQQQAASGQISHQPLKAKVLANADDRTNTVLVTAPADTLQVIDGMVRLLDANPAAASQIRVFQLQYADAGTAAKLILSMFQPNPGSGSSGNVKPTPGILGLSHNVYVNAASDDRTNTLMVSGPTEALKVIEGIVHQLDSNPASEETFFIYRLKNAQSANLSVVLNQLFGNYPQQGGNAAAPPGSQQRQTQTGGATSPFGRAGQGGQAGAASIGRPIGAPGGTFGGRLNNGGPQSGYPGGVPPLSSGLARAVTELTGQVFVVADPDTNSLLVTTATKYLKQVREIIQELDHPVPQVLIKVLVAEVTHDNSADFGVDFSILNTRANHLGQSFGQSFGSPGSGLTVSFVENQLNATLHALAQQNKLDVLSRPYILASDNQLAEIMVGQDVPLITNSYITDLGQTINTISYDQVGIILDVTPHINPEGLVIMDVTPQISELTSQTVPISSNASAPVIAMRSATSRVGIKDGQTIVIGGLMQDQKTTTINKIPILGDLPLLKYVFSRTQVAKTKTELLIFLTPHVAQEPDTLSPMSKEELKGTRLTPHAVSPGTFDEHLRGLRRGEVPQTRPATTAAPEFHFGDPPATQSVR